MKKISIIQYLEKLSKFAGNVYGKLVREQFKDSIEISELGMLACPTGEELEQLNRAVAIMTPHEKKNAAKLTDDQVRKIAEDAKVDPALLAIFINGFALHIRNLQLR